MDSWWSILENEFEPLSIENLSEIIRSTEYQTDRPFEISIICSKSHQLVKTEEKNPNLLSY